MSFNETLNLKNVSKNSNEKELIRTEADYEKALAERD